MGSNLNRSDESLVDKSVTRIPFEADGRVWADLDEDGRDVALYRLASPLYGMGGVSVDYFVVSSYGAEEVVVLASTEDGLPIDAPEIGLFHDTTADEALVALGFEDVTAR